MTEQEKVQLREELAKELDGIEYPVYFSQEILQKAKENDFTIAYGLSDNLLEFAGAIEDEVDATNGTEVLVHKGGLLEDRDELDTDEELEQYLENKKNSKIIELIWAPEDKKGTSWVFKTEILHSKFNIMEGGVVYCEAIIFHVDDIAR